MSWKPPEPTPRTHAFEPRLFDPSKDEDRLALERALEGREIREVHDSITGQAEELVECRNPSVRFTTGELRAAALAHIGSSPAMYGTWVHFPWSGHLVHVLPEPEFAEVRTSRNRNKITRSEQALLGRLRIGIVGLSVGQATAITLALEGIGRHFRLADFDALALSNLNRLRAGVHELGQNKAILTARRIFELNPYARVDLFSGGVTEDSIHSFLGRDEKLHLLFEECDDLSMKVRLREEARNLGIPVLMETSDRGLLDVERFDREPERPLFHGLAGDLDSRSLHGLSAYEKVPTVLAIIGDVSARAGASLVDIEATLRTWPQLASAVALGSAVNTDAARRIALGTFSESGRYYVELDRLVADGAAVRIETPSIAPPVGDGDIAKDESQLPKVVSGPLEDAELRSIVTWAGMAPSGGNAQPWSFVYRQAVGELEFSLVRARATSSLDFECRGSLVALGAAVENARLAAVRLGRETSFELSQGTDEDLVATMRFGKTAAVRRPDAPDDELCQYVEGRTTRRSTGDEAPLSRDVAAAMCGFAEECGGRLDLVTDKQRLASLGKIIARGDRLRLVNPLLHDELVSELRWSGEEATSRRDGLDLRSLELTPTDIAAMRLLRSPEIPRTLREIGGGDGLERAARKAVTSAAAVGLLRRRGEPARRNYLEGGRLMQRIWLWAEANGLGLHPMTGFLYWFEPVTALEERLSHFESAGAAFSDREKEELFTLRKEFRSNFAPMQGAEILFFRLVRARPPPVRSLRLRLSDTLMIV